IKPSSPPQIHIRCAFICSFHSNNISFLIHHGFIFFIPEFKRTLYPPIVGSRRPMVLASHTTTNYKLLIQTVSDYTFR
ncbi:MAG: hypothetical protein QN785_01855, partial [Nitrososphaeraceae archaeon]|nr:hypothetical protein [Nitrososphaeraceae archaeon]